MKKIINWVIEKIPAEIIAFLIMATIFLTILGVSAWIVYEIITSDMPVWLKYLILRG